MKTLYIFGFQLNGLEFITYILIPISIILIILIYIYFNIKLIKISFDIDIVFLDNFDRMNKNYLNKIKKKIDNNNLDDKTLEEEFAADLLKIEKMYSDLDKKEKV